MGDSRECRHGHKEPHPLTRHPGGPKVDGLEMGEAPESLQASIANLSVRAYQGPKLLHLGYMLQIGVVYGHFG
ncbi:MAG: hypothetical protein MUF25_15395 [Pirellulaceae bacterium]|nr:hypothetical protein [Pirellulaceae bacterium]